MMNDSYDYEVLKAENALRSYANKHVRAFDQPLTFKRAMYFLAGFAPDLRAIDLMDILYRLEDEEVI